MKEAITLRQLQEIYLDMLRQFHAFCTGNNLTYYMVGGTLLGAVREKGFIAWDDDVDIAMPRLDYERFSRIYSGEMLLQTPYSKNTGCFPYIKFLHGKHPVLRVQDDELCVCGDVMVQFDIYPIDGLGSDYKKAQMHVASVSRKKWLLYLNQSRDRSKNPIKNVLLSLWRCVPGTVLVRHIDRTMRSCGTQASAFVTRWREGALNGNVVAAEIFGTPQLMPFETLMLYAPQDYDAYLTGVYGDYMKPQKQNTNLRHDVSAEAQTKSLADRLKSDFDLDK